MPFEHGSPFQGEARADVVVVGGGFTGLTAALELAERGLTVILLERGRIGHGASGRNGGQIHSGQRQDVLTLEREVGTRTAQALFALAEEARSYLHQRIKRHAIACDLRKGLILAAHKPGFVAGYLHYAEHLARHYGYALLAPLDRAAIRALVASDGYHGGLIDHGGGHLHPLNLALGLAAAARAAGAKLFAGSPARSLAEDGDGILVHTNGGSVRARHAIVAAGAWTGDLAPSALRAAMPLDNFIVATEPLGAERMGTLIANGAAVSDSRWIVHYFRPTPDHRLLFGGGEAFPGQAPADIVGHVRPHLLRTFPQLAAVRVAYGWGGTLSITRKRLPFVRRVGRAIFAAAGCSGQGVVLAPYHGKILADAVAGEGAALDLLARLPMPDFPGGLALRQPLLSAALAFYAVRDRL